MEPTPKEKQLLERSKAFDAAVQARDQAAVEALLAPEVTVHKDDLTLFKDLHGAKEAAEWVASYWERYDYEHVPIVGAVNEVCPMGFPGGMTFSFWEDKGVRIMDINGMPELPEEARRPRTTAGIWHFMYDADLKIADIWFLRELSADEYYRKMKEPPPEKLVYNPESFRRPPSGATPGLERRARMLEVMSTYEKGAFPAAVGNRSRVSTVQGSTLPPRPPPPRERRLERVAAAEAQLSALVGECKGSKQSPAECREIETAAEARLELLEHCLAPDLELDEAVFGRVHKGIEAIEAVTRDDFAKTWDIKELRTCVAATGGSKAFDFWHVTAFDRHTNKEVTLYGLRLVKFNAEIKMQRILAFRQLTPAEQAQYVKPELRREQ